jgi:hypothetical protein
MATEYAAPPVVARLDRREEARQDRLVRARIENDRLAALAQADIARREADERMKDSARTARAARRAAARTARTASLVRLAAWASEHVIDLLFVPVIGVPALLSWTAMGAFGMKIYGPVGVTLPAFSEGAMWAFAGATTLTQRRYPGRPVWHLRAGTAVFAAFGAALNFLHGLTSTTQLFPGLPSGPVLGGLMAGISIAGVIAHQLITAGPRGKHAKPVTADEPDTTADSTPDTVPSIEADSTAATAADSTPAPKRPAPRPRRGQSTADRVTTLKAKHPDMSATDIAGRLKVSDRTVRRYLSPSTTDEPQASAA